MKISVFLIILIAAVSIPAAAYSGELADRFNAALEKSTAAVSKASISRDLVLNALKNAVAVENEAEDRLLAAIRSNDPAALKSALKKLTDAREDSEECLDCCMEVIDLASEAITAGDEVKKAHNLAADTGTVIKDKSVVKRVERLADSASSKSEKAAEISKCLKKKWLEVSLDTVTPPAPPSEKKTAEPMLPALEGNR